MSVVVSGRRRIYVLLLFRERLHGGRVARALAPVQRVFESNPKARDAGFGASGSPPFDGRLAVSARLQRRWGRSVFGLSLFVVVLDDEAGR
jgi:hypothetical protein